MLCVGCEKYVYNPKTNKDLFFGIKPFGTQKKSPESGSILLSRPKNSFGFFCKMLWKNLNEFSDSSFLGLLE